MKIEQVVLLLALTMNVAALNEVTMSSWQTNITVTGGSVTVCSYSVEQKTLLVASGNTLTLWSRTNLTYLKGRQSLTINQTVLDAKLDWSGERAVAIGTTTTKLYFLTVQAGNFTIKTLELNQKPTSLAWGFNSEMVLVGLANGSISVYSINRSMNTCTWSQVINTTHMNIARITGFTSRFISCGHNDSNLHVYFYNITLKVFQLNQSLTYDGSGNCTALDLSVWEDRFIVGRSNGDVLLYKADDSMIYTRQVTLAGAHNGSVRFVKITNHDATLLTVDDDGNLKLWTEANNFTVAKFQPINATAIDWNHYLREFVVADNNSNITLFRLRAGNCSTNLIDPDSAALCTCPQDQVWLKGNCTNCKGIPYSDGMLNTTTKTTCSCLPGTSWKYSLQRCIISCSTAPNSNGTQYQFNSCYCNNGSIWDYSLKACRVNCSLLQRTVGNFNHTVCNCPVGFYWDTKKTLCFVNCTGKGNSNGKSLGTTTCECNSGYLWDGATLACTSTSGSSIKGGGGCPKSSNSTAIGLAIGIPLGLLALCGIAAIGWYIYKTRQNEQQKAVSSLAGYAAPISTQRQIPHLNSGSKVAGQNPLPTFQKRNSLVGSEIRTQEEMVPKL